MCNSKKPAIRMRPILNKPPLLQWFPFYWFTRARLANSPGKVKRHKCQSFISCVLSPSEKWVNLIHICSRSQACTRFPQVLTSVENLLAVGVMKPSLPSSSTTAKPSNVIQYSISLMWTPFRSKHGPPDTHTHTQKDPLHEQIMRQF